MSNILATTFNEVLLPGQDKQARPPTKGVKDGFHCHRGLLKDVRRVSTVRGKYNLLFSTAKEDRRHRNDSCNPASFFLDDQSC
jgi:hypothetical protein